MIQVFALQDLSLVGRLGPILRCRKNSHATVPMTIAAHSGMIKNDRSIIEALPVNDEDFGVLTVGAPERALVLIGRFTWLNANEPHWHIAPPAVGSVERWWRMSGVL